MLVELKGDTNFYVMPSGRSDKLFGYRKGLRLIARAMYWKPKLKTNATGDQRGASATDQRFGNQVGSLQCTQSSATVYTVYPRKYSTVQ